MFSVQCSVCSDAVFLAYRVGSGRMGLVMKPYGGGGLGLASTARHHATLLDCRVLHVVYTINVVYFVVLCCTLFYFNLL